MPRRNARSRRLIFRLLFFGLAGSLVSAVWRKEDDWEYGSGKWAAGDALPPPPPPPPPIPSLPRRSSLTALSLPQQRARARRLGATLVLVSAFFAGAALSAGAGDHVIKMLEVESAPEAAMPAERGAAPEQTPAAAVGPAAEPADEVPAASVPEAADPASAADPQQAPADEPDASAPADESAPESSDDPPAHSAPASFGSSGTAQASAVPAARQAVSHHSRPKPKPVLKQAGPFHRSQPDAEAASGGVATIWLDRQLPDPTPPSMRLNPAFADRLARVARRTGADWAVVLAVLRAQGKLGSAPASSHSLAALSRKLVGLGARKDVWAAALAYSGRTTFADRAAALSHYYRAVGLNALVSGLEAAKPELAARLLRDPRVQIYAAGRGDIVANRVDVRVLVLIAYLADAYGEVSVSCLVSGHRFFARPGVVSAHVYGRAVDIADLAWMPITGNQQPGGLTEKAVRAILLLPSELQPKQVISLLGLGGPSFPLADHDDHIHVGF